MQRAQVRGSNVLPVLGLVLLVPPAYFLARWIRIFNQISGHDERVEAFGSILPGVLQNPMASTLFAAASAAASVVVGAAGLTRLGGPRRLLSLATLWAGGLLCLYGTSGRWCRRHPSRTEPLSAPSG